MSVIYEIKDFQEDRRRQINGLYNEYLINRPYELSDEDKIGFTSLYVTSFCHLKCIHCHAEETFSGLISHDADTEQILRIINKLSLVSNRIQLTGGEIMSRRDPLSNSNDVPFLVSEINRRKKETIFQTAGMHFNNKLISWLALNGVKWVSLSLDGPDIETSNIIRKVDKAFSKVVNVIPILKENGLKVKVGTVVTRLNCDIKKLLQLGELMKELKVDNWKLIQFFPRVAGRASNENGGELSIDNIEFNYLIDVIKLNFSKDLRITVHTLEDFHNTPALLVQPNGIVTVTVGNDDSFVGNILSGDFGQFLSNLNKIRVNITQNEIKTY